MSGSSAHYGVTQEVFSMCGGLVCWRDDLLTKLLILDEMPWYLIILINTNDSPPKFGTVDFLCAVLRLFYMSFNSLIIEQ